MSEHVTIAVDAMGGDNAPSVVLAGCELALAQDPDLDIILCGPADVVEPFAAAHERCEAAVATQVIGMGEHPAEAVRKKKDSSIAVACRLVKEGRAQGFYSAGSTGACLAAATLIMGRIKGISRPALATVIPSPIRPVLMCDVGANADCKPQYLVQFAQMASVYAKNLLGMENPRVALLNIGSEETKGSQLAQECHQMLKEQIPNFAGNAEGGDVMAANFDVFVCDGFTGNVCLKTIEGTAKQIFKAIKGIMTQSLVTKLGAATLMGGFKDLKDSIDPDKFGGAPLLGVKGACIIGHGSSSDEGILNGVAISARVVRSGLIQEIADWALAQKAAEESHE
ncbi:MAG: phosphate acyltransferase PlsX [Eggerthellales bacterium]|nr:phosphate acyltransferase PlsX [Eggerthellales bacterium]